MPTTRINSQDLKYFTKQRTAIEIGLASSLYDVYNSQPIIGSLREIVGMAIENLVGWCGREDVKKAMTGEKGLDVWKGQPQTAEGLTNVWKWKNTWTASECADLLRLFGTVIDESGIGEGEGKELHRAARVGPDARFKNVATGQDRARQPESKLSGMHVVDAPHSRAGRDLIKQVKMNGPSAFYGIGPFRLMPGSIIRKIDVAFGLPEGADISGTTADSVFGMGRVMSFADACGIALPGTVPADLLHLLPLVSMIAQGHHTVVESATVLTLNGKISYSIGFYSTLLPRSCSTVALMDQLRPVVAKAEANSFNQPILGFYDVKNKVYAGYLFDKNNRSDMVNFMEMATVGEGILTTFKNISEMVPEDQIVEMMSKFSLSPP